MFPGTQKNLVFTQLVNFQWTYNRHYKQLWHHTLLVTSVTCDTSKLTLPPQTLVTIMVEKANDIC